MLARAKPLFGVLLISVACLLSLPASAKTSVWLIESGERKVYLGGTIHMLAETDYPLPAAFDQAFESSDILVFETDMTAMQSPANAERMASSLVFTDGRSLSDVLAPETLAKLQAHLKSLGVDPKHFEAYRPAGLSLVLAIFEYQRRGWTVQGVDAFYWRRASAAGKERKFLESVEQQIGFLDSLHEVEPDQIIDRTIQESAEFDSFLELMRRAWREGDTAGIDEAGMRAMREDFPGVYRVMLSERNLHWLEEIEQMLDSEAQEFVLVGAGHMVGPDGLLTLLRKKGYQITQQ